MEPASNYMYWSRVGFQCKNCIEHPFGTPPDEGSTLLLVPLAFLVSCSLLRGDCLLFHFNALAWLSPVSLSLRVIRALFSCSGRPTAL